MRTICVLGMFNFEAFRCTDETHFSLSSYGLQLDILRQDFKSGLEALLKAKPIRAIFLGVRIGDPTAVYKWFLSTY